MSEMFMETAFPLREHSQEGKIREVVRRSLYGEDAGDGVIYTRSSWIQIQEYLDDHGIKISPEEEIKLMDFTSEYASLADEEDDMAELKTIRNQGGIDE